VLLLNDHAKTLVDMSGFKLFASRDWSLSSGHQTPESIGKNFFFLKISCLLTVFYIFIAHKKKSLQLSCLIPLIESLDKIFAC